MTRSRGLLCATMMAASIMYFQYDSARGEPSTLPEKQNAQTQATQPFAKPVLTDAQILSLPQDKAYVAVLALWGEGYQSRAEQLSDQLIKTFPRNQNLMFFTAMCIRSRFEIREAHSWLARVFDLDHSSMYGQAAEAMMFVDSREHSDQGMKELDELTKTTNGDPLILWEAAIACRTLNNPELGVTYYNQLLKKIPVGPSLLHQTYANMLDKLQRYDEALEHREMAVKLEPASWSYQGLAATLWKLKRYDEASKAYEKAVTYNGALPSYWGEWGVCLLLLNKPEEALSKGQKALELDSHDSSGMECVAQALARLGKTDEAIAFCEAHQDDPKMGKRMMEIEAAIMAHR